MRDPTLSRLLTRPPLGELLVSSGCLAAEHLREALECQRREPRRLGQLVVDLGFAREHAVVDALARQLCMAVLDLDARAPSADAMGWISIELAERHCVFPVDVDPVEECIVVATADPTNLAVLEELTAHCGRLVRFALSGEQAIVRAIRRGYHTHLPARRAEAAAARGAFSDARLLWQT